MNEFIHFVDDAGNHIQVVKPLFKADGLLFINGVLQVAATQRFIPGLSPTGREPVLIIEDYVWWTLNQKEVKSWMMENLSQGTDCLHGSVITFDNAEQRSWFMLKWG